MRLTLDQIMRMADDEGSPFTGPKKIKGAPITAPDLRPLVLVRPEPSDATRVARSVDRARSQAANQGTMGVPSGLMAEPIDRKIVRLGASYLPPVDVPEMIDAGRKFARGDYGGGAQQAGMELAFAAIPFVGQARRVGKAVKAAEDVAKNVARSNLTNESVATVFDGLGADAAKKAAAKGTHLKQNPTTGQYIGAPRGVDSPQKLGAMRSNVDAQVESGVSNAPWYARARQTARDITGFEPGMDAYTPEGVRASLFARGTAAYSPQATPPTEVNAFLRQHNAKVLRGDDIVPRTKSQAKNVGGAYVFNPETGGFTFQPGKIKLGKKTGPYADAKDPTVDEADLYQTANDIWHGRVFGYTGTKSNPNALFQRGFTPQEHGFLTGENLLMAQRAQERGLMPPGYESFEWTPRAGQAATWGAVRFDQMLAAQNKKLADYDKAMAKFERAKAKGKKAERPKKPEVLSLQELRARANAGIDDAVARNVGAITAEFAPGSTSGMYEGFFNAPASVQDEFARESLKASGRYNPVVDAVQMFQEPVELTQGQWIDNATGETMHSLTDVSRPLVGLTNSNLGRTKTGKPRRGGPMLDETSRGGMEVVSGIEGVIRGQQGVGMGKFTPANQSMKRAEQTGAYLTGSADDIAQAKVALEDAGLNVMDYGDDGIYIGKYAPQMAGPAASGAVWNTTVDGREVQATIKEALGKLSGTYQLRPGRLESGLTTVPWGAEGSGQVARFLDETLSRPDVINAAQRLDAAGVPSVIDARRDVADRVLGPVGANTNRPDVQRLMDLLSARSGGGFQNFQRYVRENGFKGLPAAAITAGGLGALGKIRPTHESRRQQNGA